MADVCIVCCDGLTAPARCDRRGLAPGHRAAVRGALDPRQPALCLQKDWGPLTKDLRLIYTAVDEQAAEAALEAFAQRWERRYPAIVKLWPTHCSEFVPFLAVPPDLRRVVYTTNLIESMNARLRKVTRNRGQFPSEQAALKVLYLAVGNLEDYRRSNTGSRSSGWQQALQAFTIYFDSRLPNPMTATITYTEVRTLPCPIHAAVWRGGWGAGSDQQTQPGGRTMPPCSPLCCSGWPRPAPWSSVPSLARAGARRSG
ncbi:MAG: transposase [Actinomycetota bacterium]|nr:transposase [Actinomycetota bacterium]